MKAESGHIVFKEKFRYKDLEPVFEEMLTTFLEDTDQMPDESEILQMFIRINMMDIEKNRKPEGYNRRGRMKLVFPIRDEKKELYVKADSKTAEVVKVTEKLSRILKKGHILHTVEWDRLQATQG